jgi:hypothetical protein
MINRRRLPNETGVALLIALIALSLFSILGLYMTLNATTGLQISDNQESRIQATYAARSGINHARVLLRSLSHDSLLTGPDGVHAESSSYLEEARDFAFRNPVPVLTARFLDVMDPAGDVSGLPDDGIISTGLCGGTSGTPLVPLTGIGLGAPGAHGTGSTVSRYFVKVTDNSGEATEVAGDPEDNPFADGDGIVIVRSMGVAKTLSVPVSWIPRRNSVVVFEGRFKRLSTFDLGPALMVLGARVEAAFAGAYEISGGLSPGIGVIDTLAGDAVFPGQLIREAAGETAGITGGGLPRPSVQDMTGGVAVDSDKSLLLNPVFLRDFFCNRAPRMADQTYDGDQIWIEGSAPNVGAYDAAKPQNDPEQDPRFVVVNGDLSVTGSVSGGGLLIVTGDLSYSGPFTYSGLIVVAGSGRLIAAGSGQGITGGVLLANLAGTGEEAGFGTPGLSIAGDTRIAADRAAVRMALSLIPPAQISFREIAGQDP